MKTLCLSFLLLISGCAHQIHWARVPQEKLTELCPQQDRAYGCTVKTTHGCYVYTLDTLKPASNGEQWVLGHETMHCFRGDYHPLGKTAP